VSKVLLVDRLGGLLDVAKGQRVAAIDAVHLAAGVIPALLRLRAAGYELAIVGNEPGLGADALARTAFDAIDAYVRALFASQGVEFAASFVCPHRATDACACRLPAVGLVREFIAVRTPDRELSAVVGRDEADLELALNLGMRGFKLDEAAGLRWADVAHALVDRPRTANVHRHTRETDIRIAVDLDSEAEPKVSTGLNFFDHMLEQLGKHGGFGLVVDCSGDLEIDEHHTVEDVALTLGQALREALGEKRGIQRYGFVLPMDEADAEVSIDLGGRPFLVFEAKFPRERVGDLPTELVPHFFRSLAETLGAALHVRVRGENTHHMVEVAFKGVARALRQAFVRRGEQLPTTKGQL
jgi:imidazoleglycerol-phosphate dehydratase / histidinol-phosphatase